MYIFGGLEIIHYGHKKIWNIWLILKIQICRSEEMHLKKNLQLFNMTYSGEAVILIWPTPEFFLYFLVGNMNSG